MAKPDKTPNPPSTTGPTREVGRRTKMNWMQIVGIVAALVSLVGGAYLVNYLLDKFEINVGQIMEGIVISSEILAAVVAVRIYAGPLMMPEGMFYLSFTLLGMSLVTFFTDKFFWMYIITIQDNDGNDYQAMHRMRLSRFNQEYLPHEHLTDRFLRMVLYRSHKDLKIDEDADLDQLTGYPVDGEIDPDDLSGELADLAKLARKVFEDGNYRGYVINYMLRHEMEILWVGRVDRPRRQVVQSKFHGDHNATQPKWWYVRMVGSELMGDLVSNLLIAVAVCSFLWSFTTEVTMYTPGAYYYTLNGNRIRMKDADEIIKKNAKAKKADEFFVENEVLVRHPKDGLLAGTFSVSLLTVIGLYFFLAELEKRINAERDEMWRRKEKPDPDGKFRVCLKGWIKIADGETAAKMWSGLTYAWLHPGGHFVAIWFTILNDYDEKGESVKVRSKTEKDGSTAHIEENQVIDAAGVLNSWQMPTVGRTVSLHTGKLKGDTRYWELVKVRRKNERTREEEEIWEWQDDGMDVFADDSLFTGFIGDPDIARVGVSGDLPGIAASRFADAFRAVLRAWGTYIPETINGEPVRLAPGIIRPKLSPLLWDEAKKGTIPWPPKPQEHSEWVTAMVIKKLQRFKRLEELLGLEFAETRGFTVGDLYFDLPQQQARGLLFEQTRQGQAAVARADFDAQATLIRGAADSTNIKENVAPAMTAVMNVLDGSKKEYSGLAAAAIVVGDKLASTGALSSLSKIIKGGGHEGGGGGDKKGHKGTK